MVYVKAFTRDAIAIRDAAALTGKTEAEVIQELVDYIGHITDEKREMEYEEIKRS